MQTTTTKNWQPHNIVDRSIKKTVHQTPRRREEEKKNTKICISFFFFFSQNNKKKKLHFFFIHSFAHSFIRFSYHPPLQEKKKKNNTDVDWTGKAQKMKKNRNYKINRIVSQQRKQRELLVSRATLTFETKEIKHFFFQTTRNLAVPESR